MLKLGIIRLTYHNTTSSKPADRPVSEPTEEIEVTPEMALAGARVLVTYHPQRLDWLTKDIATEIYRAMHICAGPREEGQTGPLSASES